MAHGARDGAASFGSLKQEAQARAVKTMIIGDIHGCVRPLKALLARLQPDESVDRLILLGDLFDRGPDSWQVFGTVQVLADAFGERFALLRGNHEDYLLQPKLSLMQRMVWERVGRSVTVRSFKSQGARMEDAAPWLRERCRVCVRGEGFQCVHAGIKVAPLEANDTFTLIHDHDVVPQNRYAGPLTVTGHIALDAPTWFAGDGQTVVKLDAGVSRRLPEKGVLCIDTGCGKGGRLTAMVVEEGRYILFSEAE